MKILIIGGTGFIGSHLVSELADHELSLLHRGNNTIEADHVQHIISDWTGLPAMCHFIASEKYDVVVDMISSNENNTRTMAEALSGGVAKVVVVSSGSVYQSYGHFFRTEPEPVNINNMAFRESDLLRSSRYPYAGYFPRFKNDPKAWLKDYDKILVEEIYESSVNIDSCIVRLPLVYGPKDPDNRVGAYLNLMAKSEEILMNEDVGNWKNSRSYVENVAVAIRLIIEKGKPGSIYNVSELTGLSEKEWVEYIGLAAGWEGEVKLVEKDGIKALIDEFPKNANYQQHLLIDSHKIRNELNYSEPIALSTGIEKTIAKLK